MGVLYFKTKITDANNVDKGLRITSIPKCNDNGNILPDDIPLPSTIENSTKGLVFRADIWRILEEQNGCGLINYYTPVFNLAWNSAQPQGWTEDWMTYDLAQYTYTYARCNLYKMWFTEKHYIQFVWSNNNSNCTFNFYTVVNGSPVLQFAFTPAAPWSSSCCDLPWIFKYNDTEYVGVHDFAPSPFYQNPTQPQSSSYIREILGADSWWGTGKGGFPCRYVQATAAAKQWYAEVEPNAIDTDDPYQNIPDSQPSGPADATGIPGNDPVDIPNLPTVAVSDTGFVTLFNPTLAQVKDLADYMWNGLFDVNNLRKLFADPMDCILGFNMLPVAIPNSGPAAVTVGNISTGVSMNKATSQWVELDCGTLDIGDAFGNYLSYAPYTKFSMYLPYIGIVELSTDDVVGKTLALKYHIDVLSCACVAYLKCGPSVLYQFTGSCGYSIPINGNDFRTTIASIVSIAATIGGAVATGGLTAPAAVAVTASTVNNVMNSKPQIHRSGAIGSSAGILGIQKPYLIVEYPNPCKPKKQYHFTGYPSFVTVKLSDITGYAAFEEILIEGVPCTEEEQAMIKNLCKGGIFL